MGKVYPLGPRHSVLVHSSQPVGLGAPLGDRIMIHANHAPRGGSPSVLGSSCTGCAMPRSDRRYWQSLENLHQRESGAEREMRRMREEGRKRRKEKKMEESESGRPKEYRHMTQRREVDLKSILGQPLHSLKNNITWSNSSKDPEQ